MLAPLLSVPMYIYYIIAVIWQIFFILGSLKLRKLEKEFRCGTFLLISGIVLISISIFDIVSYFLGLEFGIFGYTYIPLIITLLQIIALGMFFIVVGAKNNNQDGKWLLGAGCIQSISSIIRIYIYLYLILNCVNLSDETSGLNYVCIANSYESGLAYLQLIFSMLGIFSNLLFLIFSTKLKQKFILYAAIILFCSYLFIFLNDNLPGTLNWFLS